MPTLPNSSKGEISKRRSSRSGRRWKRAVLAALTVVALASSLLEPRIASVSQELLKIVSQAIESF